MTTTAPKLPRELLIGGFSVAIIARPISAGTLAHKPLDQDRMVPSRYANGKKEKKSFFITACAKSEGKDADEAYRVSAAWADHLGAVACTEPACFPNA